MADPLFTLVFASQQLVKHTHSFRSLNSNNHPLASGDVVQLLTASGIFWPVNTITSSFTPTRKLHLSASWLESGEFGKQGSKPLRATAQPLEPINASSSLNFSPSKDLFYPVLLSMATGGVEKGLGEDWCVHIYTVYIWDSATLLTALFKEAAEFHDHKFVCAVHCLPTQLSRDAVSLLLHQYKLERWKTGLKMSTGSKHTKVLRLSREQVRVWSTELDKHHLSRFLLAVPSTGCFKTWWNSPRVPALSLSGKASLRGNRPINKSLCSHGEQRRDGRTRPPHWAERRRSRSRAAACGLLLRQYVYLSCWQWE